MTRPFMFKPYKYNLPTLPDPEQTGYTDKVRAVLSFENLRLNFIFTNILTIFIVKLTRKVMENSINWPANYNGFFMK